MQIKSDLGDDDDQVHRMEAGFTVGKQLPPDEGCRQIGQSELKILVPYVNFLISYNKCKMKQFDKNVNS